MRAAVQFEANRSDFIALSSIWGNLESSRLRWLSLSDTNYSIGGARKCQGGWFGGMQLDPAAPHQSVAAIPFTFGTLSHSLASTMPVQRANVLLLQRTWAANQSVFPGVSIVTATLEFAL